MKRPVFAILTLLILLTVSCGKKGRFVLHGTVQQGIDSILVVGFDSRFEDADTLFCPNGQFIWKYYPDTVTTLILVLPDGRTHPVFAEKDVESFITIPADTGLFSVSGGYCNDSYQSFYLASQKDTSMKQTIARIDSFITRDPFSDVTPFLIYDQMVRKYHAKENTIDALVKRMSGNMQDAPYLVYLKSNYNKAASNSNNYLDNYSLMDSTGHKRQFIDFGGVSNHLLVCVWASWMGQKGIAARDTMAFFKKKYADRYISFADISIDPNTEMWKEAIAYDTVSWPSYNDPAGWESRIVQSANLQTIPAYILFTGAKRVAYKTTSLEELDKELDRTLIVIKKEEKKENKTAKRTRLKK